MMNNQKQLKERHCTSIIQLIKQGALEKIFLLVSYKKKGEFYLKRIRIEIGMKIKIFC